MPLYASPKTLSNLITRLTTRDMLALSHDGRPRLFVPLDSRPHPVDGFPDARPRQRANRQHPGVANAGGLLALEDLLNESLFDPDHLDAVLAVLLVGEDEQRHALSLGVLQDVLEDQATLVEPAGAVVLDVAVANVGAVDDEDDGVAAGVVALPQLAQAQLAADVPDLEVHVGEREGRNILADRRHRLQLGIWAFGQEERLGLFVEGRLAGVVEAEKDHRVFCAWSPS